MGSKTLTWVLIKSRSVAFSSNKVVEYRLWTALRLARISSHARRTLLDSGATPKVVQRQLRHSDARTTLEICGHLIGDAQRQAVEQVASVLDAIGRLGGAMN
jgi:hypothetical protein